MYLDTSVVAKLYFNEPESRRISGILTEAKSEFCSSGLLIPEFHSVACRKLMEKLVTQRQFREVVDKFMEHDKDGTWRLYPVTRETLSSAGKLIEELSGSVGLKTLDAIHFATCVEYSLFPLFTTDKVMLSAAKELKLEFIC
jgi:predicted nucleic acid-binding protein